MSTVYFFSFTQFYEIVQLYFFKDVNNKKMFLERS